MNARSYTLSPFKGKLAIGIALFSLITGISGIGTAHAKAAEQDNSQILKINLQSTISLADLEKQNELLAAQQARFAKIDKTVTLVQNYLGANNSPLAPYAAYLVAQQDWIKIIAISNAESNMGLHCYLNNCWGIGSVYNLKGYKTMPEAIVDVQALIDKRYKSMTLSQMDGVYVQPRSANWLAATTKVYNDLEKIQEQIDSDQEQNLNPVQVAAVQS